MRKLLLDTNTLNYLLKGIAPVADRLEEANAESASFLLAAPAHYELTRYLDLKGAHRLRRIYLQITSSWQRCNLSFEDWSTAAQLWAERHKSGKSISDMDLLLATLALREGAVLVTANVRHFEGLSVAVENWTI
ncbi:MAG TPA: PIN domain-containing protein [Thermoanaerobaculia bacterium]